MSVQVEIKKKGCIFKGKGNYREGGTVEVIKESTIINSWNINQAPNREAFQEKIIDSIEAFIELEMN